MSLPASRCPSCQRVDVPATQRCPVCAGPTEEAEVDGHGTVLARTRGAGEAWVLLVRLGDDARALARAGDPAPSIGDEVSLVTAEDGLTLRVPREPSTA